MDKFENAKVVDLKVHEKADKLIEVYSRYYFSPDEVFIDPVPEGEKYTVGCWINEETTIRFAEPNIPEK